MLRIRVVGRGPAGPSSREPRKQLMSTATILERPLPAADESADGSAKRRQIMDGAREMFLTQGFDAASMGEIARAAGVSKGTLYVYFKNKEQLFEAIVQEQCASQTAHI